MTSSPKILYRLRQRKSESPVSRIEERTRCPPLDKYIVSEIIGKYIPIEEILRFQYYRVSKSLFNKILKIAILSQNISPVKSFLWLNLLCKTYRLDENTSLDVNILTPKTEDSLAEIQRDIVRTMPSHPKFAVSSGAPGEQNRIKLFNLLRAVSSAEPAVGYCQGMNFVAATLLLNLNMHPNNSFLVFLTILTSFHYKNLYSPAVPLLPLRMFMFSRLVRQHVPQVWHHLNSKTFSVEIFANQWIMTLYSYYVDPDILGDKIWTLFFLLGWKFIFIFGLAILHLLQPQILAMDVEQISQFMASAKSTNRRGDDLYMHPFSSKENVQSQLEMALVKFKVKNSELDLLAKIFLTDKIIAVVQDADLSPAGSTRRHLPGGAPESMDCVDSKQMGFTWLASKEGRKEFLRIDLSFLHTPNRPFENTDTAKKNIVDVPVHSLQQMTRTVDMVSQNYVNEINRLSSELIDVEKRLNLENKQFNSLVATAKQTDEVFLEITSRKEAATISLQHAVVESSAQVTEMIKKVSAVEREYDDKKELRNSLYAIINGQEKRIIASSSQKSELILKISALASQLEQTRHDVIYRSIQSAIDSFSTNV